MKFAYGIAILIIQLLVVNASYDGWAHGPTRKRTQNNVRAIEEDKNYWKAAAEAHLQRTLNTPLNTNVAKNVILFLGDGMGISTVTAARIYAGQQSGELGEDSSLAYDKFPHVGLAKTYNIDFQVPDSAGTACAFLTSVKTNKGVIGFDGRVAYSNCSTVTADSLVDSVAKMSQDKGKRTGLVTSTRVTHATPANVYAHSPDRNYECDADLPVSCQGIVKDIATQLADDVPGKNLNVIMGGGFATLDKDAVGTPGDPLESWDCLRVDARKLWQAWLDDKLNQSRTAAFVRTRTELNALDLVNTEFVMGIFANSHVPYEYVKSQMGLDMPTLAEMTEAAITVLSQGPNGFFLLVEGGRIDHAHHDNQGKVALDEAKAMNDAVLKALELTSTNDTLIVVTADHSHTLSMSGYPERGTDIAGFADFDNDGIPYTTLGYANGPGYNFSVVNGEVQRFNLTGVDTSTFDYVNQAGVLLFSETHGGEDVAVFASGPMSHLFTSVYEQNYIATAMAYASCVDITGGHCIP